MTSLYIHLGVFLCVGFAIVFSKWRDHRKFVQRIKKIQEGTTEYAKEKKKRYNSIVKNFKMVLAEIQNFNNDYPRGDNGKA
jgi:Flp pilus assembly protein TadB